MENMKLTYHRKGDYLYPNLVIGQTNPEPLGKYCLLRRTYLKEHRTAWYKSMLLTGALENHLRETDRTANERMETLMSGLLQSNPAPDKETDQLGWVRHMNSLTAMAEETVLNELIYC